MSAFNPAAAAAQDTTPGWRSSLALALACLYLAVLPASPGLYNAASLASALAGLVVALVHRRWLVQSPAVRTAALVFACLWLPMVVSSFDALDPPRAFEKTALYLRFALGTVFMVYVLRAEWMRRWLRLVLLGFYGFWTVDAVFQALVGFDFFGYPYPSGQLRGVFYPKYRLGVVLTVFAPLMLDAVAERARQHRAWWLAVVPVVVVVALTLHRNSWLMLVVGAALYAVYAVVERGWRPRARTLLAAALGGALCLAALGLHDGTRGRVLGTVSGFLAEKEQLEAALGQRPDIWRTALGMFAADPLDGIGPRGFRGAYAGFAAEDDYWRNLQPPQWPTHPHQLALEVLAETGLLGALGLVAMFGVLLWRYRQLGPVERARAGPWLLCLVIAVFPANVHKAFYGHFLASLVWWLLAICVAMVHAPQTPARRR